MKGILATICAFALIGSSLSTFPNDMYYHHHPDLIAAGNTGGGNIRHAQQQTNGHSRNSDRNRHRNPPHRNNYHGGSHHRNSYGHRNSNGHRNSYGHYKRNFDDKQQGGVVYTKDGGIDWSKTPVSKVASDSNEDNDQRDYGTSPNNYQRNQKNPFDDEEDNYQQQSSNNRYDEQSRYNNYDDDNYYNDDDYSNNGYYEDDYYDRGYDSYSRKADNGYNDRGDDYSSEDYGSRSNNNGGYNNRKQYSHGRNAYTSDSGSSEPSAYGIRLAGTLSDDGYNHGEGTFFDLETHIGTCGKQSKNTEFVVALNAEQMGDSSSRNENCNKEVEVTGPSGKTVRATIVDSCKTCKKGGLDLSPAAFEEIGEFSQGSIPIKWKFV